MSPDTPYDADLPSERTSTGPGPVSGRHAFPRVRSLTVLLLCLPAILSTGVFLAGVLAEPFQDQSQFDPFTHQEGTVGGWLQEHVLWPVLFSCFLGAAYGPLLIPIASVIALRITRGVKLRSRTVLRVWAPVVLGLIATGVFWGWLIDLEILP